MVSTLFIILGALLLAMLGGVVLAPRPVRETEEVAEAQARMMEAIANSVV
jgi:hypothetical protein